MIHHLSIPVTDPRHVADVLVELLGGHVTRFGPYPGSFIAWADDAVGSAIEVYPVGTEMFPDAGRGQAQFRHNGQATPYVATHATVSVEHTREAVLALAEREGWRALVLSRGSFDVIEFWIENHVMLEVMTRDMTAAYLRATARA